MPQRTEATIEPALRIDADVEELLSVDSDDRQSLLLRAVEDDARIRAGIARRLIIERATLARLTSERDAMLREYEEAMLPVLQRIADIESVFEQMAIRQREAGRGNRLVIPGVGEWATRRVPGRWELDNDEVLAALQDDPDGYREFVDPGAPAPPVPRLIGQKFRRYLDQLRDDSLAGRERVTDEDRIAAADQIASTYGGHVRYHPPAITVTKHEVTDA